jgi:HSP20 family protein
MGRLFDDAVENVAGGTPLAVFGRRAFPALNIWEDDTKLHAEAELPGLKLDDLELYVHGNELTIKGERQAMEEEGMSYHRHERGVGTFFRRVTLPTEVDPDKVEATLRDGVLTITMPKAQAVLPRKIKVTG